MKNFFNYKNTVEIKISIPRSLLNSIVESNTVEAETPFEFYVIQQIRNRYNFNEVEEITDGN